MLTTENWVPSKIKLKFNWDEISIASPASPIESTSRGVLKLKFNHSV